jgi:CheY-like chemotaxis protein
VDINLVWLAGLALVVVVALALVLRRGKSRQGFEVSVAPDLRSLSTQSFEATQPAPAAAKAAVPAAASIPVAAPSAVVQQQAAVQALREARRRAAEDAARLAAEQATHQQAEALAQAQAQQRAQALAQARRQAPVVQPLPPAAPVQPLPSAVPPRASSPNAWAPTQPLPATPPTPTGTRAAKQPTVLVVDDSKVVRVKTSRLLEKSGYRVLVADDGLTALASLQTEAPDLVITDVEMPGMDGFEFTRQLRASSRGRHLPVVMITSSDDKHRAQAQAVGVNVLLGKPYEEETLLAQVGRMLAGQRVPALH